MSRTIKKYQAIHSNSVCNRILVRHIRTAISYLFIYLFIFSSNSASSKTHNYEISSTSEVRNDARVSCKGILKYHESISAQQRNG